MALGYQIIIGLEDRRVLLRSDAERRLFARRAHAIGGAFGLLAFRAADTHAHKMAICSRKGAGELARRFECSLRYALDLDVPFAPARIIPIRDQPHGYSLFNYLLRQEQHHGIALDPFHEASCLPDLLGMRVIGGGRLVQNVARLLPRVVLADLVDRLPPIDPAAPLDLAALPSSACAALALPGLRGHGDDLHLARLAAVHAAVDVATRPLAELLCCSPRQIRRLRLTPADPAVVIAVQRQWHMRSGCSAAAAAATRTCFDGDVGAVAHHHRHT